MRQRTPVTPERLAQLKRMRYSEYLLTQEWQRKRRLRLKLDGYKCVMCGSGEQLEVHHIDYSHRCQERQNELRTLCHSCHRLVHTTEQRRFA